MAGVGRVGARADAHVLGCTCERLGPGVGTNIWLVRLFNQMVPPAHMSRFTDDVLHLLLFELHDLACFLLHHLLLRRPMWV
eukprot:3420982-Pleurochrysis_carterae.AAC.1